MPIFIKLSNFSKEKSSTLESFFDWINFIHALMLFKDEGCPSKVLFEFRVVVVQAIKTHRLTERHLADFDLRINTSSKQVKARIGN
jgi:hypothetical protein